MDISIPKHLPSLSILGTPHRGRGAFLFIHPWNPLLGGRGASPLYPSLEPPTGGQGGFPLYPALVNTRADLDFIKQKVEAKEQPWYGAWQNMCNEWKANSGYTTGGSTNGDIGGSDGNRQRASRDAQAAYYNILRWYVTGDEAHAKCAVNILNKWTETVTEVASAQLYQLPIISMVEAAELVSLYDGWAQEDREAFKTMCLEKWYPGLKNFLGHCGSWPGWDGPANLGCMVVGVFCDRQDIFDEAVRYYKDDADATLLREAIDLNSTVSTALNNGTYGNEEAMAKVAEVRKAIVTLKASAANDENPVDMTEVIVNPDFANNNADGWTVDAGTAKCGVQNTVFEGYSGAFDIHQVITGVPQGTYKISAKGFYRRGNSENANNCYLNDTTIIAASIYGNGADSIAMQNIVYVDDIAQNAGTGSWKSITINDAEYFYPNDRATARNRFDNELYENELFTCVGEDGILVIGLRNTNPLAEDWSAVSNFRLTCYGKNSKHAESTGISDINAVDAKTVEIYNVNGMRVNAPVKGINILKIEANGKTVTKKVVIK